MALHWKGIPHTANRVGSVSVRMWSFEWISSLSICPGQAKEGHTHKWVLTPALYMGTHEDESSPSLEEPPALHHMKGNGASWRM